MLNNTAKHSKFSTLKSIFSHLHEVGKHKVQIGLLMMLYIITIVSEPYFYMILMNGLQKEIVNPTGKIPETVIIIIITWITLSVLTMVIRYIFAMRLLTFQHDDWRNFLIRSMDKMLRLPTNYHISIQHGEKQKIIDRGSEAVWEAGDNLLLIVIPQIIITIILIIMGFFVDIRMTFLALILLPVSIIGVSFIGKSAYKNQREANSYWDRFFGRISDTFTNLNVIRIFGRSENEVRILDERLDFASIAQNKVRKLWVGFNAFGRAFSFTAKVFVLSCGIIFMYHDEITLGTLLFFLSFADRIYGPILAVFESYQRMMINVSQYEKLEETLNMTGEKDEGKTLFSHIQEGIHYQDVSFHYPSSEREVLSRVNMEIKKGQHIALVGHTGSGKSTIIQLLMRFYEPTHGSIFIDGRDIFQYSLESYRKNFAAVFQDTTLFNDSIKHNLTYVRDNISDEELEKACREANIYDFIMSLPEGFETEVGERGLKLSGGEKQRISIARAILANPEILILDEATSALDTKTERLIQEAFRTLMKNRTSIIIAHRLSTIMDADKIYLLEKGSVVAEGTHQELYKTSKDYKEMVDMQHDGIVGDEDEDNSTEA